ncbi:hypothetical protein [Micromonospora sp. NPDC005203]|uniref:hypothetical protein n=1 Tax=Micromonospora sp. NPDC005203 TaxID=3364226 RepID=UPI0036829DE7
MARTALVATAPHLRGELRDRAEAWLLCSISYPNDGTATSTSNCFAWSTRPVTFGLIDESDAERGDWVELHPDRLGFTEPCDGLYST